MIRPIDFTPLTTPATPAEVTAFKSAVRSRPEYSSNSDVAKVALAMFVIAIFVGIIGLSLTRSLLEALSNGGGSVVSIVSIVVGLAIVGLIIFAVIATSKRRWQLWYRFDRFATANGLVYSPTGQDPQYPGAIFSAGRNRVAIDHFRSQSGRFLDYGNYRYVTGSGKSQTTHTWGFLALQLDRALPNMVLDSRANNGLFGGTNLPTSFSRDQVLHLEGDFDKYFTLYCPKEYERDALYVFTPDLMALLIDNAAPFDVEIVDKWMFVYSTNYFALTEPAVHSRLLSIVDTVGAKTLTQTDRYVDERVANFSANVVAPQGQRLRRGVSVGSIVIVVAFIVIWAIPVIGNIFSH